MAVSDTGNELKLLKKTKISVFVDEVLPDILVVTYEFGVQIFKGVLLDSTKRNLPLGVQTINPAFSVKSKKPDDDPLYTVNQRFAYMDPNAPKKKNIQMGSKYKNNKMTVRLRPRQVLCSKCKGICNENSENVSRKRKNEEDPPVSPPPVIRRGLHAPITRSVNILNKKTHRSKEPTLVPRLTRIHFQEDEMIGHQSMNSRKLQERIEPDNSQDLVRKHSSDHSSGEENAHISSRRKRLLRKKRSISSLEDWEDTSQQENTNRPPINLESPRNLEKSENQESGHGSQKN
ncbi:unnamed protein product [Psylliodes chrysocephalus]|uniref:PWWP domain-containing protein 2A n=1 Tax=Psylliodes chrysocephalus TaxID=3402493 RepID=A0A9P0G9E8_9CUCU|nr:unnamed protein product [Psylliodes chrysocephala]